MSYDFRPAKLEDVPLLLGVAGGTGSGKTFSALRLARGLASGHAFAGVDTENRRMNHYANHFPDLHVTQMTAPFRPERYTDAIAAAVRHLEKLKVPREHRVVVVDSASHEWAGDGGCLDWHAELTGGQMSKNQQGWATVKPAHKRMVTKLLQLDAHVILAFRAEPKLEEVDDPERPGKKKWVAKRSVTALDGWFAITEKMLPYELTASFLLMADSPGVPKPIKLEGDHRPFVPLDQPLSEDVGRSFGEWATGRKADPPARAAAPEPVKDGATLFHDTAIEIAAQLHPPADVEGVSAEAAAMTLQKIFELGEQGETWLRWAAGTARDRWPEEFGASLELFVSARLGVPA